MMVTMKSSITGNYATINLPITQAQWEEWKNPTHRRLVQDIFPQLSNEQREFLMTGITPIEWETYIAKDDEIGWRVQHEADGKWSVYRGMAYRKGGFHHKDEAEEWLANYIKWAGEG